MMEITAKQLYDIYSNLPDPYVYHAKHGAKDYHFALLNKEVWSYPYHSGPEVVMATDVSFKVDASIHPFEWKPTTDLIIKAES